MRLAIVGYGKMGRLLDRLSAEAGFEVAGRFDLGYTEEDLRAAAPDVAIEFSTPEAAVANLELLARCGVPAVCGTTGWYGELDRVRAIVQRHDALLVYGANYSIGVNVFQRVVAEAARLLRDEAAYGAWAWEIHHDAKKDAPSGTLIKLVEAMKDAGYSRTINVSSNRAGMHPGTHEIGFDSAEDTITLRHAARSRDGFARGALKAARWAADQARAGRRGVFEFSQILFSGGAVCS